MYKRPETRTVTIASGETTSSVVGIGDYTIAGVHLGAALTGATIGFAAAPTSGGSFQTVKDSDGNTISLASNAAGALGLSGAEADALAPWQWIKIVSASAEAADRTITLALK